MLDYEPNRIRTVRIDDKWSIAYDSKENDKPLFWIRHEQYHSAYMENNAVTAMFYNILENTEDRGYWT